MKRSLVVVIIFALMTGWYGCTKDSAVAPPAAPICDSTKVRYTENMAPIIATNCALPGCHASPLGTDANDMSTYINLKTAYTNNSLLCRIQGTTCGLQMPEYARPLSTALMDTFALWQSEGYCE